MKTVELDEAEVRMIARALRDRDANLDLTIRDFKKAYGNFHEDYTMPLQSQRDDIALILAKLGETK